MSSQEIALYANASLAVEPTGGELGQLELAAWHPLLSSSLSLSSLEMNDAHGYAT